MYSLRHKTEHDTATECFHDDMETFWGLSGPFVQEKFVLSSVKYGASYIKLLQNEAFTVWPGWRTEGSDRVGTTAVRNGQRVISLDREWRNGAEGVGGGATSDPQPYRRLQGWPLLVASASPARLGRPGAPPPPTPKREVKVHSEP